MRGSSVSWKYVKFIEVNTNIDKAESELIVRASPLAIYYTVAERVCAVTISIDLSPGSHGTRRGTWVPGKGVNKLTPFPVYLARLVETLRCLGVSLAAAGRQ